MASPISPLGLQAQTPAPVSPLTTVSGLMQLKGQMVENALRAAQTQQAQAQKQDIEQQTQLRNQEVMDNNTLQSAMGDPATAKLLGAGDYSPLNGKVRGTFLQKIEEERLKQEQTRATLSNDALTRADKQHTELGKTLDGILETSAGDPAKIRELWSSAKPHLLALGFDPQTIGVDLSSPEDVSKFAATNNAFQSLNTAALSRKEAIQKTATQKAQEESAAAEAALHRAELPGTTAKAQIEANKALLMQQAVDAFKTDPEVASKNVIDAVLPETLDKTTNTAYRNAYKNAMQTGGPDAAQAVVSAAAAHAAALSPEKRAADVKESTARIAAAAPIEIQKALTVELQKAKLAGGLSSIIDPQARNDASRQYDLAATESANTFADSQRLLHTIELAQAGNRVAPTLETLEELRGITNRVTNVELHATGLAGSTYDRVRSWLGGAVAGQPIPENIQKDMVEVGKAQQKLAQQKLALKIGVINAKNNSTIAVPNIAKLYDSGAPEAPAAAHAIPNVGDTFNGHKVLKVEKVQ